MPENAAELCNIPTELKEGATLTTLNAFAIDLISIPNIEDLFWYVAQNVVGHLKFVDCVIYLANDEQTSLVQVAALGEKNPFGRSIVNPLKIPFGQGITGQVAQSREAIIVDDLRMDQNYIEDTQRARSEICVPIVCDNRVVGVIDSEHAEPGAFGAPEMEVLTTIAAMTSAKLELLAEADRSKQRYHDLVMAHAQLTQEATNRKALETELFNARKLETVGRLTGRFAHEFNNLLTVVSGNLEFLDEAISDGPFLVTLQAAQTSASRGAELIQSMLAYSQRAKLSPERMNLNTTVEDIIARDAASGAGRVVLTLGGDTSPINVDKAVFETVLLHLIKNARDAMPEGSDIHIETDSIMHGLTDERPFATALAPGRYVRLSVRDRGVGIPSGNMQLIFDPFYTTKPVGSGLGLGLSKTLGFMQQSGGTVAVLSDAGKGATIQLYFPALTSDGNDLLTISR